MESTNACFVSLNAVYIVNWWVNGVPELSGSVAVMICVITAVSVDELRQAACQEDNSQSGDASSHCSCELDTDSQLSLPQRKVRSDQCWTPPAYYCSRLSIFILLSNFSRPTPGYVRFPKVNFWKLLELYFLQAECHFCCETNSIKPLKDTVTHLHAYNA